MKRHWERIENFDFNGITKEIKKLVKQKQAENLIEVSWDDCRRSLTRQRVNRADHPSAHTGNYKKLINHMIVRYDI
jgi:undecaprenyl pyrophosphate synthase